MKVKSELHIYELYLLSIYSTSLYTIRHKEKKLVMHFVEYLIVIFFLMPYNCILIANKSKTIHVWLPKGDL